MFRIVAYVLEGLVYLLVLAITSPLLLFLGRTVGEMRGEMVVDSELFANDEGIDVDMTELN